MKVGRGLARGKQLTECHKNAIASFLLSRRTQTDAMGTP